MNEKLNGVKEKKVLNRFNTQRIDKSMDTILIDPSFKSVKFIDELSGKERSLNRTNKQGLQLV